MVDSLKQYLNKRLELMRLVFAERISNTSASFTAIVIFIALFSLMFLFLSLALGFYIGEEYHSYSIGFFSVGIIYFIILILLIIFRKALILNPIRNKILLNFLNPKTTENEKL